MYRIKEVLQEKGMKSKDLAESLGKSKQQISNILNGSGNVSMSMLSEIANALKVPVWQLLVSPKEVNESNGASVKCPNCNHEFKVRVNLEAE